MKISCAPARRSSSNSKDIDARNRTGGESRSETRFGRERTDSSALNERPCEACLIQQARSPLWAASARYVNFCEASEAGYDGAAIGGMAFGRHCAALLPAYHVVRRPPQALRLWMRAPSATSFQARNHRSGKRRCAPGNLFVGSDTTCIHGGLTIHTVLTENGIHFTDPKGDTWSAAEIRQMIERNERFQAHAFSKALIRSSFGGGEGR